MPAKRKAGTAGGRNGGGSGSGGAGANKRVKTKSAADADLTAMEKQLESEGGDSGDLFDGSGVSVADRDHKSAAGAAEDEAEEDDAATTETAEEKKLRLVKSMLQKLKQTTGGKSAAGADGIDAASDDEGAGAGDAGSEPERSDEDESGQSLVIRDRVHEKLTEAAQKEAGRLVKPIAHLLTNRKFDVTSIILFKGHEGPVTSVSLTADDNTAYTASKDCSLIRWDLRTGKRLIYRGARNRPNVKGHTKPVWAVAVSSDGRYVASGGVDQQLHIWDTQLHAICHTFKGHRNTISCLAFRRGSHQLFSGSFDRQVKIWDLDQMGYVDTMFGPQSEVTSVDALNRERAICCANDRTVRYWKYTEEKQLLYRAHHSSIDSIALCNDERFITASQDGSIASWSANKKRPVTVIENAHGGHWVLCVAALAYTDVCASGSSDGFIRLWKIDSAAHLSPLAAIPVSGFVNGLCFAHSGKFLLAAVGTEQRLGRWHSLTASSPAAAVVTSITPNSGGAGPIGSAGGSAAAAAASAAAKPSTAAAKRTTNTLQMIALDDTSLATIKRLQSEFDARNAARAPKPPQQPKTATTAPAAAGAAASAGSGGGGGGGDGASTTSFKPPASSARAKRAPVASATGAAAPHPHAHLSIDALSKAKSDELSPGLVYPVTPVASAATGLKVAAPPAPGSAAAKRKSLASVKRTPAKSKS